MFYVNLPLGAVTLPAIVFTLKSAPPGPLCHTKVAALERRLDFLGIPQHSSLHVMKGSFMYRALTLDWIGGVLRFSVVFMLLLAFQWGGLTYAWDSPMIIGLLVGCGINCVLWIVYEWFIEDEHALLPPRFCHNRSVCGSTGASFFMLVLFVATYYLPLRMCTSISIFTLSIFPLFPQNFRRSMETRPRAVVCDCEYHFMIGSPHYLTCMLVFPIS